ncbi:Crp/Fnr family transcriptional regulator [Pontixanthobacter aestiaquae]|uniref:Cyclic nucleotide-binding domain-containing protein n=1 Tax=Pontixanthobacter aestiaquae TaxID=1509367 RepID=A0A844YZP0_9SPHN|nr:Crp/Fnr family transcriptional regulator [Pontixanthobacter aestiaquae]MDN3647083.1 Crp/Fnr family transcriptional regulator [Pontixanthobacter aestiaquae]MXO81941.1 cyclic nucleotide-binding domain-containing protein [Pontixanthobacter aestiaquae]
MSNSLQSSSQLRSLVVPTLFRELDEDVRKRLLAGAPRRSFADGKIIQQRGDDAIGFWVIETGQVKIGQFRLDGEFRAIALLSDGDSYGELALFAANRRVVDAVAEGPVELRWIEAQSFEREIKSDPDTMRRLVGNLAAQLQEVLDLVAGLGKNSSLSRVASVLANLAPKSGGSATIALGQQELGELTGLTRATVNKCLSILEARGALKRHYGRIEVLDRKQLRLAAMG